jgi:hypothetical protein
MMNNAVNETRGWFVSSESANSARRQRAFINEVESWRSELKLSKILHYDDIRRP